MAGFIVSLSVSASAGEHVTYFISLGIEVAAGENEKASAHLTLASQDGDRSLTIDLTPDTLTLVAMAGGVSRELWRGPILLSPGQHAFLLKSRPDRIAVYLHRRLVVERTYAFDGRPRIRFEPSAAIRLNRRPGLQPAEQIYFADGFARTEDEGLRWEDRTGRFSLSASRLPENAQSAFRLVARSPERCVALASDTQWFWDDYRFDVSVKAEVVPATWGMVFYHASETDWCEFVWHQPEGEPGVLQLVRHRNGREEVLASTRRHMRPEQWYRATVVVNGGSARAYLCGERVLAADDPTLVCGRVGLLVEAASPVHFDDVVVRSVGPEVRDLTWKLPEPLGSAETSWGDLSGKAFSRDAEMRHWAQPRSFWTPEVPGEGRCRFASRVFHDATFLWQASRGVSTRWPGPMEVELFAAAGQPGSGYRFVVANGLATILKGKRELARHVYRGAGVTKLECRAAAGELSLTVNGKRILRAEDAPGLRAGQVYADLGPLSDRPDRSRDWRDRASVLSAHRLDYTFEAAPTAWQTQNGVWRATHRWACVPKWSFYGGRGKDSATGADPDCAVLWNRRRFAGDFDLDLFFAPMEASAQRMHFSFPVNLNVVFAADGRRLDSGYALVFGATDIATQLFSRGRPVASFDGLVEEDLRRRVVPFYRRTSRTWQHVRVCREGSRVEIQAARFDARGTYRGLVPAISYDDPQPPAGDRLGLWTWGANGMALARATVSFADSPGLARGSLSVASGAATVRQAHDGRILSRSKGAATGKARTTERGRDSVRVVNVVSGGHFEHVLVRGPIDLERTGTVEFDIRGEAELALSLFARVRGQTGQAVLWGADQIRNAAIPLGEFVNEEFVVVSGTGGAAWRRIRVDLFGAFRSALGSGPLVCASILIASPFETVEQMAGLGVNRPGSGYDVANVRLLSSTPTAPPEPTGPPRILVHGIAPLDDFESTLGGWERFGGPDGAALHRDPANPGAGRYSLSLANEILGGPAGAWACMEPYDLERFPVITFRYRWPRHAELNLLVRHASQWKEIRLSGRDATWTGRRPWPLVGRVDGFITDGEWREARLNLQELLGTGAGTVRGIVITDTAYLCNRQGLVYWIDDFCRVPAVDPERGAEFIFECASGTRPVAYSHLLDDDTVSEPPPTPTGQGDRLLLRGPPGGSFLHVRVLDESGRWSRTCHLPLEFRPLRGTIPERGDAGAVSAKDPPPAPYISYVPSDRLCRTDFEWSQSPGWPEGRMGEFAIRRQAWVLRNPQGATGDGSALIVNLNPRDFYSAYFRRTPYDPGRWPRISFDYRFLKPGCALNLSAVVNGTMAIVEWTGRNPPRSYFAPWIIGRADTAIQDRRWHHVELDLQEMIRSRLFSKRRQVPPLTVSELATWATTHTSRSGYRNPVNARVAIDNFCIFSPRGRDPAFEWKLHGWSRTARGFSVVLDRRADTVPPKEITTSETRAQFKEVLPGRWFFHVRACDGEGRWGPTAHHSIEIVDDELGAQ